MKKLLLLALLAMIMVGCKNKEGENYFVDERGYAYKLIVVDSCEYVIYRSDICHKGNCKYCLERSKKMIKEQIDTALIEIFD